MSFALSAGVTGLQAHQQMLDVAGNNLANVNTTGFKASRITFSELLSQTIKRASQPTSTVGGTNPQQIGSGVGISGISPNMTQGSIVNTGNSLDLAVEGEGYFVLSDGSSNVYTRAGAFSVDADSNLVDPSTGYLVQRIGSVGESDGFQTAGDSNVKVPYDVAIAASATSEVVLAGNLSASNTFDTTQTQKLSSEIALTTSSGTAADSTTLVSALDQFSGSFGTTDTDGKLYVTGYQPDGTAVTDVTGLDISATTTLADVLSYIESQLGADNVTASVSNGKIVVADDTAGYSRSDISLSYTSSSDGTDSLTLPAYFELTTVGGEEVQNVNITVYDNLGGTHTLSGAFVRTDTTNTWDMVLTSVTGDISAITPDNRRIQGIEFATDGSYSGLNTTIGDTAEFAITFAHDASNSQTISMSLGTAGQLNGLTQFAADSTAVAQEQDGYKAGRLSTVSVDNGGTVIGAFSNGIKKDIATIQIALFQNTSGLESVGSGYFIPSANSGEAVATQAMTGGAGTIHGGALEKSNADVASEFVSMIQAQNGFQANARTITVANDILNELTGLIR
ncbi:MAG TPA: flagellar hook-basal body complex protein [Sedimentisphaerales bacterium]|nr:flagellar hook-basal body complex protein [Sedimentisphaerales bacterium]